MRALVIIEIGIIAWTMSTAFGPASGAVSTRAYPFESYACARHPDMQATWATRCPLCGTALRRAQSPALIRVGAGVIGPGIDMDNRRRDEDEAAKRKRQEELREQYRNYGYPPGGYRRTYPPPGYTPSNPPNGYPYYPGGRPYPYSGAGWYYRDPVTGRYYYVSPQSGYSSSRYYNR